MDKLEQAMNELNHLLKKRGLRVSVLICGAFAMEMHGLKLDRRTDDVDSATPIDPVVLDLIDEVAAKMSLTREGDERWLNDKASTVALPPKLISRAKKINKWSNIDASLADRRDLISMKVSAFFTRRDVTTKDIEDLKAVMPTNEEIEEALDFVKKYNSPPDKKDKQLMADFEESVDDVRRIFIK